MRSTPEASKTLIIEGKGSKTMGVEGTFSNVFSIFRKRWGTFLVVNAISVLLNYVIAAVFLLLTVVNAGYLQYESSPYQNPAWWAGLGSEFLVYFVVQCLADGTNIRIAAEIYAGHEPQLWPCFRQALDRFFLGGLFKAWFALALIFTIPLVLILVVLLMLFANGHVNAYLNCLVIFFVIYMAYTVYFVVITYHTYSVAMIEDRGGWGSVRRSVSLNNQGHFGHVFLVLLLWFVVKSTLNALVSSLSSHDAAGTYHESTGVTFDLTFGGAGDGFLSISLAILFAAVGSILQTVVYLDIRGQSEGYTVEMLRDQLGLAPQGPSSQLQYVNMDKEEDAVPALANGALA